MASFKLFFFLLGVIIQGIFSLPAERTDRVRNVRRSAEKTHLYLGEPLSIPAQDEPEIEKKSVVKTHVHLGEPVFIPAQDEPEIEKKSVVKTHVYLGDPVFIPAQDDPEISDVPVPSQDIEKKSVVKTQVYLGDPVFIPAQDDPEISDVPVPRQNIEKRSQVLIPAAIYRDFLPDGGFLERREIFADPIPLDELVIRKRELIMPDSEAFVKEETEDVSVPEAPQNDIPKLLPGDEAMPQPQDDVPEDLPVPKAPQNVIPKLLPGDEAMPQPPDDVPEDVPVPEAPQNDIPKVLPGDEAISQDYVELLNGKRGLIIPESEAFVKVETKDVVVPEGPENDIPKLLPGDIAIPQPQYDVPEDVPEDVFGMIWNLENVPEGAPEDVPEDKASPVIVEVVEDELDDEEEISVPQADLETISAVADAMHHGHGQQKMQVMQHNTEEHEHENPHEHGTDYAVKLTKQDISACEDNTNFYRKKEMDTGDLVWDQELADGAQAYAELLMAKTKKQGKTAMDHAHLNGLGENLFWGIGTKLGCSDANLKWYNEYKDFDFVHKKSMPGKVTGHFTQLVWKGTKKFGIGVAIGYFGQYYDRFHYPQFFVVGRYKPAGNYMKVISENVGNLVS